MKRNERFKHLFTELEEAWQVEEELLISIEEFTCALYGKERIKNVNELRFFLLQSKCGKDDGTLDKSSSFDLSALPPCKDTLREHLHRVNYQVGIWKRAHIAEPDIPNPVDGHGWTHS